MFGAAPEPGQTKAPRPTKAAYRYIRGNEGWTPSPIVKVKFQDGIPDDPEDNLDNQPDPHVYDDIAPFVPDTRSITDTPISD